MKERKRNVLIDSEAVRSKLPIQREPYWARRLRPNQSLGYRKMSTGANGTWIARIQAEDGKRTYKSLGTESELTYLQAKTAAEAWFDEVERGVPTDKTETVTRACEQYVKNRRTVVSEENSHDADMRFRRLVYGTPFGAKPLSNIKTTDIKTWFNALTDPERKPKPLAKASANRTLTSLKAAFNLAVEEERVGSGVSIQWEKVKAHKKAGKRRDVFLDLQQRQRLLRKAKGAIKDLIQAAMLTGARPGELVNARCSQFDERNHGTLNLDGKTGPRFVPLAPAAVKLFKRLKEGKLPTDLLLTRDDGQRWNHSDWDELVREAADAAKLQKGVCLMALRSSYITSMLQAGMAVSDVASLVGTSADMIEDHYHQFVHDHVRARLARVRMV